MVDSRLRQNILLILFACSFSAFATKAFLDGEVRDQRSGKPLLAARICLLELDQCAGTDSSGSFHLRELTPGLYTAQAACAGYDTLVLFNVHIKSGVNDQLVLHLQKKSTAYELQKVSVKTKRLDRKKLVQINSVANLDHFVLNNTAGTANDLSRVLEILPSTVMGLGEDFDNNLYVRGGQSAENVFVVDGIELENVSHFGGLGQSGGPIGFLNTELVRSLDFYAGSMPANLPPRLSSVIDITMRDGSFSERKHQIDLNASGVSFLTEGPLLGSTASYLLNMRAVDLRFLKPFLTGVEGIPRYGDGFANLVFRPSNKDCFSTSGIFAYNQYREDGVNWRSQTHYEEDLYQLGAGAQWRHFFEKASNTIDVTVSSRSEHENQAFIIRPDTMVDSNVIIVEGDSTLGWLGSWWWPSDTIDADYDTRQAVTFKNAFSLFLRSNDRLDLGLVGKYLTFDLKNAGGLADQGWYLDLSDSALDTVRYSSKPFAVDSSASTYQIGGYGQYVFVQNRFKTIFGLRGDYYSLLDDAALSPRLALSIDAEGIGVFSLSGGVYYQLPSRFDESLADVLVPNPNQNVRFDVKTLELQRNWQAAAGFEKQIRDTWLLTVESYYKLYDREYPLIAPGEIFFETDTVSQDSIDFLRFKEPDGRKRVFGFELLFQKKKYDVFYYSLAYSFFSSKNEYAKEFAGETWFDDEFNVRNALSLVLGSNFKRHHGLSLRMSASEGLPFSKQNIVKSKYGFYVAEYDSLAGYYTERFDPLVSVNARYNFKVYRNWGNITGYLEVMNLLNYKPTVGRWFRGEEFRYQYQNGILPVAGVTVDF